MSLAALFQPQNAAFIGGALNSLADDRQAVAMARAGVEDARNRAAYDATTRARQAALLHAEQERQQMYARTAAGGFDRSLGEFRGDFEGRMGSISGEIADIYRRFLADQTAKAQMVAMLAPAAKGPAADREASERAQASAEVAGDAGRLANVESFGQAMTDAGRVMTEGEQLASLISNLSRGSAAAGNAEIAATNGQYVGRQPIAPMPSIIGDLFVGMAGAAQRGMQRPAPSTGTGLQMPTGPSLPEMGGGQGLRPGMNTGIGLKVRPNTIGI